MLQLFKICPLCWHCLYTLITSFLKRLRILSHEYLDLSPKYIMLCNLCLHIILKHNLLGIQEMIINCITSCNYKYGLKDIIYDMVLLASSCFVSTGCLCSYSGYERGVKFRLGYKMPERWIRERILSGNFKQS